MQGQCKGNAKAAQEQCKGNAKATQRQRKGCAGTRMARGTAKTRENQDREAGNAWDSKGRAMGGLRG